jgi:hypothetical protein
MRIFFILFFISFNIKAETCHWCIANDDSLQSTLESFLNLSPVEQIKNLENKKIKVKILNSNRKSNSSLFQWSKVRLDSGNLQDISKHEGSLGKTLCIGEKDVSKDTLTIILSSDSPRSTLFHEYLHSIQINKDLSWCEVSKKLWGENSPSEDTLKIVRNHEWDVRLILWKYRNHKSFNIEDRIVIAEGLINEAKLRKSFDQEAEVFVIKNKVADFLNENIQAYIKNNTKNTP